MAQQRTSTLPATLNTNTSGPTTYHGSRQREMSTKEMSTARLLEQRSLSIIRSINDRNTALPYIQHASPDFRYIHETPHGTLKTHNRHEAMLWMRNVICKNQEHLAEVESVTADVDERTGYAVVWIGMKIHDVPGGYMAGTEKVSMLYWRKESCAGGEVKWVWFRHMCLSAVPRFPY